MNHHFVLQATKSSPQAAGEGCEMAVCEANELDEATEILGITLSQTGSRVICPQVVQESSDYDYVGVVEDLRDAAEKLLAAGWGAGSSIPCNDDGVRPINSVFISLRKGQVNLILTHTEAWYRSFMLATRVATRLGLVVKSQRIDLFQALLYGNG